MFGFNRLKKRIEDIERTSREISTRLFLIDMCKKEQIGKGYAYLSYMEEPITKKDIQKMLQFIASNHREPWNKTKIMNNDNPPKMYYKRGSFELRAEYNEKTKLYDIYQNSDNHPEGYYKRGQDDTAEFLEHLGFTKDNA